MSERIRNLEDALQEYHAEQAAFGLGVHPLLQPEYLGIKSTMELYRCAQPRSSEITPTTSGSHSRKSSQATTDNGFTDEIPTFPLQLSSPQVSRKRANGLRLLRFCTQDLKSGLSEADLAAEIKSLSRAFPLSEAEPNLHLRDYIRSQLPPRDGG
jgi:hypothetical protein